MEESLGIHIELMLWNRRPTGYPHDVLAKTLSAVNSAVFASELVDLRAIRQEFPELPEVVFDAAFHRMRSYRGSALRIQAASSGSLLIAGAVAGVTIFVLKQTLGETIKDAWEESQMHERLKSFLLRRMGGKTHQIATGSAKRIEKTVRTEVIIEYDGPLDSERPSKPHRIRLRVEFSEEDKDYPPAREDLF